MAWRPLTDRSTSLNRPHHRVSWRADFVVESYVPAGDPHPSLDIIGGTVDPETGMATISGKRDVTSPRGALLSGCGRVLGGWTPSPDGEP